jgi:hypothetical protein
LRRLGPRASIREAITLIRRQPGQLLALFAILWGVRYLAGVATSIVLLPIGLLALVMAVPGLLSPDLANGLRWVEPPLAVVATALLALINGWLHALISTTWTLAYGRLGEAPL